MLRTPMAASARPRAATLARGVWTQRCVCGKIEACGEAQSRCEPRMCVCVALLREATPHVMVYLQSPSEKSTRLFFPRLKVKPRRSHARFKSPLKSPSTRISTPRFMCTEMANLATNGVGQRGRLKLLSMSTSPSCCLISFFVPCTSNSNRELRYKGMPTSNVFIVISSDARSRRRFSSVKCASSLRWMSSRSRSVGPSRRWSFSA